ncbi:superinfection immunity protein [Dehalococcoides mccartyi]|uniref:Uncharacterized protein n=1 Tax=Dehalococcoides mccartyi TaxID=61435 RepID=A0A142V7S8_9CHLR|nr:superinfection immunity protein [Dehalococcoides mccartyi]AMU85874.1 hypothetical protein Dm11a5_0042 [Dehalococcoides mccartyi]
MFDFFFGGIFGLISFAISLAFYFLPTIIALAKHRRNTLAIFLLDFYRLGSRSCLVSEKVTLPLCWK